MPSTLLFRPVIVATAATTNVLEGVKNQVKNKKILQIDHGQAVLVTSTLEYLSTIFFGPRLCPMHVKMKMINGKMMDLEKSVEMMLNQLKYAYVGV